MLQSLAMILIGLCFGVAYHVGQNLGLEAGMASILQNIYDALFYTFASFCQQGKSSYGDERGLVSGNAV
jgi:lipopolysaccharide export LptBFGC system permease protein LptF